MLRNFLRALFTRETLISLYNLLHLFLKTLKCRFPFSPKPPSAVAPPPFDPYMPSIPVSYPLKTLEELHSRAYFDSFHYSFNKSSVPLTPALPLPSRPRLLVCHDFQGGYGDDKWVQGGSNPDAYAIWHWNLIDVFVYFSHYLVSLPPPCWTNTAHKHGVKVLGTFITEWDEGRLVCNKLLETKESAQMYAERLAELAVALGFDGWLINMEIKLDVEQIPNLKEFVSHLTQTMHYSVPGSLVIWYDSVTINGDLCWQDQLNNNNKPFFDICDGIFVNYTWKRDYPRFSAYVAGDRKFDVYMGIDVFGRNTFGGGEWNTNVALNVLMEDNVSAAIFAPGWVYETKQPPDFQTAQNRWWDLIEKSWRRVNHYPKLLPFYSNFDKGHGYQTFVEGGLVMDAPWNNISCQGFQPSLELVDGPSPNAIQVLVDFKNASFNGGGNITFRGTLEDDAYFTTKLFKGELLLGNQFLHLMYSVKSEGDSLLGVSLVFSSAFNNRKTSVLFASWEMTESPSIFSDVIMTRQSITPDLASAWVIHEGSIAMNGHILEEINAVCYRPRPEHGESRSEYRADDRDNVLASSSAGYSAVLGHITIKNANDNLSLPPSTSWLVEVQYIKYKAVSDGSKSVSLKISWKLKDSNYILFSKYNIYVQKQSHRGERYPGENPKDSLEYLGVAHVEAFYVSDLSVPLDTPTLKFIIQVCGVDGAFQKLDDCPYFLLEFGG